MEESEILKYSAWDWLKFARSFNSLAGAGCDVILQSKTHKDKRLNIDFLSPSILFNIKHSLELFVKMTMEILDQKVKRQHNTLSNLIIVEGVIRKLDNIVCRYLASKQTSKSKGKYDTYYLDTWRNGWREIRVMVEYYSNLNFLKDRGLSQELLKDTENTLFRYPDSSMIKKLKYNEVFAKINILDVKNFKKDVNNSGTLFTDLFLILLFFRYEIVEGVD